MSAMDAAQAPSTANDASPSTTASTLTDRNGWDGKLRVGKQADVPNSEAVSDPDNTDEDVLPVEQIEPDEGWIKTRQRTGAVLTLASQTY